MTRDDADGSCARAGAMAGRLRTLDALHLASVEFLQTHGQDVRLCELRRRLTSAARLLTSLFNSKRS